MGNENKSRIDALIGNTTNVKETGRKLFKDTEMSSLFVCLIWIHSTDRCIWYCYAKTRQPTVQHSKTLFPISRITFCIPFSYGNCYSCDRKLMQTFALAHWL